jgi:menaquinol-cytochrome c reductase iron-sulfur subunit
LPFDGDFLNTYQPVNHPPKQHGGNPEGQTDRRCFFKEALAIIIGGVAVLVPMAAGLMGLIDPLRRKSGAGGAIKVTTLEALPDDGVPRRFPVIASKTDAWNKFKESPIGAVYLRRAGDGKVEALNVVCPHAGCFVDFTADDKRFHCPCHKSSFEMDGTIADPKSPSPRALDSLTVKVDADGAVWVAFQNFQAGRRDKVPIA